MGIKDYSARQFTKFTKRIGLAPTIRFKLLYWGYRFLSNVHTRDIEWDFVLNYLPPIPHKQANVLDIGSTSSLFIYELAKRGYDVTATDIRPYQEKMLNGIKFHQCSFRTMSNRWNSFDYITAISVLQHFGTGEYGGERMNNGDSNALLSISLMLKPGGKLLLTTFTDIFARRYNKFKGYNYGKLYRLVSNEFYIQECTEKKGVICMALTKK